MTANALDIWSSRTTTNAVIANLRCWTVTGLISYGLAFDGTAYKELHAD
jgi:hypothetical protein